MATNTALDKPAAPLSVSCQENCQPEYPSVLNGAEGSAGIQLTIDADGQVIDAVIASSNGNPQLAQEALKAAQEMEFSSIDRDRATVRINISFTVAGSDFEQQAQQAKEDREKKEKTY
ncbi:MAG: energy transducer TonB [Hydrococcus sp. SU_1_0]|nr:energy transducer TonB [Hydrococcus sp. SU_1_0]